MTRSDLTFTNKAMVSGESGSKLVTTVVVLNPEDMSATVTITELTAGTEGVDYTVDGAQSGSYLPWTNDAAAGTWTSSNAGKSSSTAELRITATNAGLLTFHWSVSSEPKWDGIVIKVNGNAISGWSSKGDHSGDMSGDLELELAAGDVVSIQYVKDSGGNAGSDTAVISNIVFLA